MKLEQLQLAAFEPLKPAAMQHVTGGGMATGFGIHGRINYASDCAEFGAYGRLHVEFYDANGTFLGEYNGPDPAPGGG